MSDTVLGIGKQSVDLMKSQHFRDRQYIACQVVRRGYRVRESLAGFGQVEREVCQF